MLEFGAERGLDGADQWLIHFDEYKNERVARPRDPTANFSPSAALSQTLKQRLWSTPIAHFDPRHLSPDMIPSTLFALVTTLSLFVAVNGAVVQRDGTFVSYFGLRRWRFRADCGANADVSDASAYGTRAGR